MKKAILWVVRYARTSENGSASEDIQSRIFTNKDDAVNEFEIRCAEEATEEATFEKVNLGAKTTRDLAASCVQYGAELAGDINSVTGPIFTILIETVNCYPRQTEDAIAIEAECV